MDQARPETESERWNRNFADLLQELRVAQTGVQLLFAFLLILPFTQRFTDNDGFGRIVYLVALLSAACATALNHRAGRVPPDAFRQGKKEVIVRSAHRMASAGLGFVLVTMVCAVLLVTDVAGPRLGPRRRCVDVRLVAMLWFVLPATRAGGAARGACYRRATGAG
jgi:hypothetical protein